MGGADTEKTKAATYVWVAALALWIGFIWGHSLISGVDSAAESGFFVALFSSVFKVFGVVDASQQSLIVRKLAHFLEHAVLGILATGAARALFAGKPHQRRWWAFTLAVCVAVPCIDETIQMFVPGRGPAIRDVCIDLAGCAFGCLVAWLFGRLFLKRSPEGGE